MKTFLIRPAYLDKLHSEYYGKQIHNINTSEIARLDFLLHFEPFGDDKRRGDAIAITFEDGSTKTYYGNEGYREFIKEWKVVDDSSVTV